MDIDEQRTQERIEEFERFETAMARRKELDILNENFLRDPDICEEMDYLGFNTHKSKCFVEIYFLSQGRAFVLFTDIGKGTSVTNAAETIIQVAYEKYLAGKVEKENCLFAETYRRQEWQLKEKDMGLGSVDAIFPFWEGKIVRRVEWRRIGELSKPKTK